MVIAAPVALLAYSRRFRQFAAANRQGLFNLGMGSFAFVLALRNIAKEFQMKDLQQAHDNKQAELHSIRKLLNSDDFGERITGDADLTSEQRATVVQAVKKQFNFVKDRSAAMYEMRSEPMGPMMTVVNRITAKFRAPVSPPPSDTEAPPLAPAGAHTGSNAPSPPTAAAAAGGDSAPVAKKAPADIVDAQGQVKGWL